MAGATGDRSLEETPTWAVAVVCAVFVIISILIEHGIHSLAKWFQKRHNKAMSEALEKIKAELMLLGFISLLLTVGTRFIAKICIPTDIGETMLPCKGTYTKEDDGDDEGDEHRRKLFWYAGDMTNETSFGRPQLVEKIIALEKGKVSLISQSGVHQLHIFIFVLAVFHVLYSVITIVLARAKVKKWKSWESETSSLEYQFTNDPERFRFTHQTSFVRRHSGLSRTPGIRWIIAFFRQFFGSVSKVDYLTMRNGFINAHLAPNSSFDFHKYIKRSMEDDFKVVVGISIPLWIFAVIFLLINVYKWYTLDWLTLVPFAILLLVGTKLELVIMEMAQEIQDRSTVNAFQMAFFLWTWYEFGLNSCFHENLRAIVARVILGVALQFLCSYITFPLYALMGSHMKKAIFEEQTAKAIKKWHQVAKERNKIRKAGRNNNNNNGGSDPGFLSGENTPSIGSSPIHLLHNFKNRSSQPHVDIESVVTSPMSYPSDTELSEIEGSSHNNRHIVEEEEQQQEDHRLKRNDGELHNRDFSFVRL
ncbi:hypothetical protein Pint_09197 [Pistacia integerrima]|uniref:Uncharacterized protein n=1 Tax=Pistacia integerrima TaxID=434235 RepID=A0ACC0Y0X6_9ROSI|nr:hypothetical protein Pint_09197 [Pistacia integerrima]